ncbi:MAG: c-type cytochrome [Gemmatimonadaceae bacterium]|nr:c-type cytochrome [Gemmatimonadaceae bacterium]
MPRWARWIGYVVGTVVLLVAAGAGYVYAASNAKAEKQYDVAARPIAVVSDSATIARGKHFATAITKCVDCHSDDLGGKIMIDDPALGLAIAPNITMGGRIAAYSDAEIARVIRHGVKRDGRSAIIMPSEDYQFVSDEDVGAIIAYLRSAPPVTRELGNTMLRPVGRTLVVTNMLPLYAAEKANHSYVPPTRVVPDTSVAYGEYLSNAGGCTGCHGPGLSGGPIPGMPPDSPPAANITPTGLGKYSDAEIETMLRQGTRPDGSKVKDIMPWRYTALMTDLEMRATLKYLRQVAPREFGLR